MTRDKYGIETGDFPGVDTDDLQAVRIQSQSIQKTYGKDSKPYQAFLKCLYDFFKPKKESDNRNTSGLELRTQSSNSD